MRVFIEETAYDRSIPYGQPTSFKLIPFFNPIQLGLDLALAVPQGVKQAADGLAGKEALSPDRSAVGSAERSADSGRSADWRRHVAERPDDRRVSAGGPTSSTAGGNGAKGTKPQTFTAFNDEPDPGTAVKKAAQQGATDNTSGAGGAGIHNRQRELAVDVVDAAAQAARPPESRYAAAPGFR